MHNAKILHSHGILCMFSWMQIPLCSTGLTSRECVYLRPGPNAALQTSISELQDSPLATRFRLQIPLVCSALSLSASGWLWCVSLTFVNAFCLPGCRGVYMGFKKKTMTFAWPYCRKVRVTSVSPPTFVFGSTQYWHAALRNLTGHEECSPWAEIRFTAPYMYVWLKSHSNWSPRLRITWGLTPSIYLLYNIIWTVSMWQEKDEITGTHK